MNDFPQRMWSVCPECGGRVHCRTWEGMRESLFYAKLYCIQCNYSEQFATDRRSALESLMN